MRATCSTMALVLLAPLAAGWAISAPPAGQEGPPSPAAPAEDDSLPRRAVRRLGAIRDWAWDLPEVTAFSRDLDLLAYGGVDGTVGIWDVDPEEEAIPGGDRRGGIFEVYSLGGHEGEVRCIAFSPAGPIVASGGQDGTVRLWDALEGESIAVIEAHGVAVTSVAFSADGKRVASRGGKGIRIWDAATGDLLREVECGETEASSLAFSPDGKTIASGDAEGRLATWKTATGESPGEMSLGVAIASLSFSPDGKRIALGMDDTTVRLWDPVARKETLRMEGHEKRVGCVTFSPDGKIVASGSDDKTVRLWDTATGETALRTLRPKSRMIRALAFSGDGKVLASEGSIRRVVRYNPSTGKYLRWMPAVKEGIRTLAYSPDGKVIAGGGRAGNVRLWDAATGKEARSWRAHFRIVRSVAFSPDGRLLATGGGGGSVRLWDAATGGKVLEWEVDEDDVNSVAFSPDGRLLATGGGDGSVRLWDAMTGKAGRVVHEGGGAVRQVAYSADGRFLGAAARGWVRLWEAESWREIPIGWDSEYAIGNSVALSPDGRFVAWAASGPVAPWRGASDSDNRQIRVVEIASGRALNISSSVSSTVRSLAFSPDGLTLASGRGSEKGSIWLYQLGAGRFGKLARYDDPIHAVAFSPDGRHLASGSRDDSILLWEYSSHPPRAPDPIGEEEIDGLWDELAGGNVPKALAAIDRLAVRPEAAIPLVRRGLEVGPSDPDRIRRLVADLDDEEFAVRERASDEIRKIGIQAEAALREALNGSPSPEVSKRANALLALLFPPFETYPSEGLRRLRAIALLERIGTREAQAVLETMAGESPSSWERLEAGLALERSRSRASPPAKEGAGAGQD